jgi:hypothetical protein
MKSTRCCAALLLLALLPACRTTSIAQERPAAVAGSFYPADPAQLANTVDRALAAAPVTTRQETPALERTVAFNRCQVDSEF